MMVKRCTWLSEETTSEKYTRYSVNDGDKNGEIAAKMIVKTNKYIENGNEDEEHEENECGAETEKVENFECQVW